MLLPAGGELNELWENRREFYENSYLAFISTISEVAYGDIDKHPWGMDFDVARLLSVVLTGMLNVFHFIFKCSALSRDQSVLINGLSYLIQCLLVRCGSELAAKVLYDPEQYSESGHMLPDHLKAMRYKPIFNSMFHDLGMHCSEKFCSKLSYGAHKEESDYFLRFINVSEGPKNDQYLILNSIVDECRLKLVPIDKYCPLGVPGDDCPDSFAVLQERLEFARVVIINRTSELIKDT